MTAAELIRHLALEPHSEGGFFRRSFCSEYTLPRCDGDSQTLMSSIFYLLSTSSPCGYLHRNRADILHFWQGGRSLRYHLLHPDGHYECVVMGPELAAGQQLQLLVKGGCWKASELCDDGAADYGLISEAVCPGFDYRDHQFAGAEDIRPRVSAAEWARLAPLIRPTPAFAE